MKFECLILFLVYISTVHPQSLLECPEPWVEHETKCYRFELYPATLEGAEESCNTDGASLVSVNDAAEHDFIINWMVANEQDRRWLTSGRRDRDSFFWEGDGTEIQGFQFWLPNGRQLPDGSPKPGTILVYESDGATWGWSIAEDEGEKPYICETSKSEVYKIVNADRGFDFGMTEMDENLLHRGPKFTTEPTDVIYDTDSRLGYVHMECDAAGNPAPTYQWKVQRGEVEIFINPLTQTRYTVTNGRLTIHDPEDAQDNGNFQCIAANTYGSVLSNKVQLSFGYLQEFPKSRREPINVQAFSGIGIECDPPQHYPAILYSWYKDTILNFVRPSVKVYTFISNDGKLYFQRVTSDDEGEYYCMVHSPRTSNMAAEGKVSMPIELDVTEAVASIREPQIVSGFPQVFPRSPKQGDTVRIECIAWGTGEIKYNWVKIGGSLPGQSYMSDNNRVLNIPDIELVHAGEYQCTAQRLNGLSSTESVLMSIDAAPYFTIPLRDQHVDQGSDFTWQCIANGKPAVTYSWYRNATLLRVEELSPEDQQRYEINNNVLIIRDVRKDDHAMYQCGAENLHGIRYSAAQLRVLSFAPIFRKNPVQPNSYGTLRGNVTIICSPEAAPKATLEWKKNNRPLNPSTEPGAKIRQLPNGNLHFRDLSMSDEGHYTCTASNQYGEASSSGNLTILSRTTITYYPSATTTVHVNRTAFLPCEASFNPLLDMTYTWYHNTRLIEFIKIKAMSNEVFALHDPHFYRGTGINEGGLYIRNAQFWHAGEYTCIATTTTDEVSVTAKVFVVGPPGEPAGVRGFDVTSHSIRLTWSESTNHGRTITSYIAEGFNEQEGVWRQLKTNIRGIEMSTQETLVTGLDPYSNYRFRMRAVNELGVGDPSGATASFTTDEAVPDVFPENIGGGGGSVGLLTITWEPLPRHKHNGAGVGYRVLWKESRLEDEEFDMIELHGAEHNKHVVRVGQTNFYKQYDVSVQAFNNVGDGPRSPDVTIYSAEGMPTGVPLNVRSRRYNATALQVRWTEVENTRENMKGVLRGYRINYWKETGEDEIMAIYNVIPGQTNTGLVIGLEPKTYYYVNVQVYNTAGTGPKSERYLQETLRAAPKEAPQEVTVEVVDSDSVKVEWRGVSTDNTEEPLQGYMVRYWRQGESTDVSELKDAEKITRAQIDGLEQNQVYNLRVFGYSRGGEGLSSSPTIQFILGPDCKSIYEDNAQARFMYGCRGCTVKSSFFLAITLIVFHIIYRHL